MPTVYATVVQVPAVAAKASRKQQRVVAHAALLNLIYKVSPHIDGEVKIAKTPEGAPYILVDGETFGYCSISHSKELALVAYSADVPVGIDIELIKPRNFSALHDQILTEAEKEANEIDSLEHFYRVFCAKEAWSKAHQKSLLTALSMDLHVAPNLIQQTLNSGEVIYFFDVQVDNDMSQKYCGAICIASNSVQLFWET